MNTTRLHTPEFPNPHTDLETLLPIQTITHRLIQNRYQRPWYHAFVSVSSAVSLAMSSATFAVTNDAQWGSVSAGVSPTSGALTLLDGNVSLIVLSGFVVPGWMTNPYSSDLSNTTKFCPALGSVQSTVNYYPESNWTATFILPVSDLLLYAVGFRGVLSGTSPNPTTYTFTSGGSAVNPTLVSGTGGTLAGNVLSVPTTNYFNGILRFTGPISSLTVASNTTGGGMQNLTFGVSDTLASCIDTPPTATNVNFSLNPTGTPTWTTGEIIKGNYTYGDVDNDVESGTILQWYQATDASCSAGKTAIASATTPTYTLVSGDVGKYICFGVIPKNAKGTGTEALATSSSAVSIPPAPSPPSFTPPPPPPLPDYLGLSLQLDGTGTGIVTTDTGLSCQSSDCQTQTDGSLLCNPQKCSQAVKTSTTVTLTPRADTGSYFSSWGGNQDCLTSPLLMNSGKLCIAYFDLLDEPLTVVIQGQGTVTATPLNCPGTCTANYPYNTTVTLQTQPTAGWQFQSFSGDCNSTGQVLMTGTKNCGATFIPNPATFDEELDHIPNAIEDAAPNHGDGNGDGIPDSLQTNVASFVDQVGGKYLTLQVDKACPITNIYSELPDKYPGVNRNHHFPQGLTYFELGCATTPVTMYYHGVRKVYSNLRFYKYGSTVPGDMSTIGWYKYPATFALVTIDGQPVMTTTYTLTDGQLGDNTGLDGRIVDPGGLEYPY